MVPAAHRTREAHPNGHLPLAFKLSRRGAGRAREGGVYLSTPGSRRRTMARLTASGHEHSGDSREPRLAELAPGLFRGLNRAVRSRPNRAPPQSRGERTCHRSTLKDSTSNSSPPSRSGMMPAARVVPWGITAHLIDPSQIDSARVWRHDRISGIGRTRPVARHGDRARSRNRGGARR